MVAVGEGVKVAVGVGVRVAVAVAVGVSVGVLVGMGVAVGDRKASGPAAHAPVRNTITSSKRIFFIVVKCPS